MSGELGSINNCFFQLSPFRIKEHRRHSLSTHWSKWSRSRDPRGIQCFRLTLRLRLVRAPSVIGTLTFVAACLSVDACRCLILLRLFFFFAVLKTTGILFGEVLCGIVWLTAGIFVGEVFFAIVKLAAGILVREVFFTIVWLTAGVLVREVFFAIVWLTTGRIRSQDRSIVDASDPPPGDKPQAESQPEAMLVRNQNC